MQIELNDQQVDLMLDASIRMANDTTVSGTYRAIADNLHKKLLDLKSYEDQERYEHEMESTRNYMHDNGGSLQ